MIDDLIPTARSSETGPSQDRENHGSREKENPAIITPKGNRSGRAIFSNNFKRLRAGARFFTRVPAHYSASRSISLPEQ